MKILFLAAEVAPYVSVGGLSQVLYFLPKALKEREHDVRIFTPKFGSMYDNSKKNWELTMERDGLTVPVGSSDRSTEMICNVKSHVMKDGVKTYFLENREYYELRANVFGYKDDHIRFALMCRGCIEWLIENKKKNEWFPEVIHCNDWHTAYFVELVKKDPIYKEYFENTPVLLTVHNFSYQGNYDFTYCPPEDRDDLRTPPCNLLDPNLQKQNALKRGILYADYVNTVSPNHAKEMLTREYAESLLPIMRKVKDKLSGILNGLDDIEFNPATDTKIKKRFDSNEFVESRAANKAHLQKIFGLPVNKDSFVMSFSGRLSSQKGVEFITHAARRLLPESENFQLIVLGGGDHNYRRDLTALQRKYPKQVGLHLMSNFEMPRQIFAGTDVLLMPSMFEPGGIVALEALRYGAVPIVRRTGGLSDIVTEFEPNLAYGNGFSFQQKSAWGLLMTIARAEATFRNKRLWKKLVQNCLEADFSWSYAAKEYEKWYENAMSNK